MKRILLTDHSRIKDGVLRGIENSGASPRVGDRCEVVLGDRASIFGRVVSVYYRGRVLLDVSFAGEQVRRLAGLQDRLALSRGGCFDGGIE